MAGLNPRQIDAFKQQGFLIVPKLIEPATLQPLIHEFEEIIDARARELYQRGRLRALHEGAPFDRRLALLCADADDPLELTGPVGGKNQKSAGMFALITYPPILDVVESLIGPEILAHPQFNSRPKLPAAERYVVPWHQDLGYLRKEADQTFMVNFWIPLVDAPMETGPLQVIPGSHQWGLIPHEKLDPYYIGIPESALPPHEVVDCPLALGDLLMIQHKTVHRSVPNSSDRVRWSLDIRYSDPEQPTGRDEVPGFMVRSRAEPDSVAKSHRDWLAKFEERGIPAGGS